MYIPKLVLSGIIHDDIYVITRFGITESYWKTTLVGERGG